VEALLRKELRLVCDEDGERVRVDAVARGEKSKAGER